MQKYTLTILDTTGIQNYIFGSNRLKENVGASELVKRATEAWVYESLPKPNNMTLTDEVWEFDNAQRIETDNLQAEVIYAGGGNALILFDTLTCAKTFAAAISKKLIATAPGINFTVVHTEFEWADEALGGDKKGVVFNTFAKLADAKRRQPTSRPLTGVSVSAFCQSTGLPAIDFDEDGHPISAETKAKLAIFKEVPAKLNEVFQMEFDFNKMGERQQNGKGSYLAVVHADGNSMGKRVERIAEKFPHAGGDNRDYITTIRKFSDDIRLATQNAVDTMELLLQQSPEFDEETKQWRIVWRQGGKLITIVPVRDGDDAFSILPYRRIIVGGDDVTFVCDGRLALTLTAAFLDAFEKEMAATGNEHLKDARAAAGIAVVKTHYPFIGAYDLAEALTKSAKRWVKDEKAKGQDDFSALDWHFAPGGLAGELDFIRKREYDLGEAQTLLMRPIALRSEPGWRNWDNFSYIVKEFTAKGESGWGDKRNKVKAFREALRKGEAGVKQFLIAYKGDKKDEKEVLPKLKANIDPNVYATGWAGKHCAYFDAIEAMDFYLPLNEQGGNDD